MNDSELSDFQDLRHRPLGKAHSDYFVVEGSLLIQRLLASDYRVRRIIVQDDRPWPPESGTASSESGNLAAGDFPVHRLSADQIRRIAGFDFHRGYLASADRKPIEAVSQIVADPLSLALVATTDMENLGSMIRSAAAFGIRQVLLDPRCVDPFARRVIRVSMGAALGMTFFRLRDVAQDLRDLSERGFITLASTLACDSIDVRDVPPDGKPKVVVMGNEADGLPGSVQVSAAHRVRIPMGIGSGHWMVDSLNVSVAAAILMHELVNRREA